MEHEKNQGEEIRPCLIGGFRCKSAPSPYVHPIEVDDAGRVVSVDMVRLQVKFWSADAGEKLAGKASLLPSTDAGGYRSYTSQLLAGRYRVLSTYVMGDSSVTLGIGLVGATGKVDMCKGFVEFNPNKVAQPTCEDTLHEWCKVVGRGVKTAELSRWDLAYDVPIARQTLRLRKDRRHFKLELGAALTEYLGKRNTAGYVKVYDKAAELGLDGVDLTRVELTCDGKWTVDDIEDHWPEVYGVKADVDGLSNSNKLLVGLLADKIRAGDTVEPELAALNKRTRSKIRAALTDTELVRFPRTQVTLALKTALMWRDYFMR